MAKRAFDLLAAGLGLLLLAPLLLAVAVAIQLDSPGPVFYRQERVGRGGRVFRIHKFRSMTHNPVDRGPQLTVGDDARITRVGAWLRRSKVDELAQLIDVLRGDMSLVGPRPELVSVVDRYDLWDHPRHRVKPGLTGPWQVSTYRSVPLHENMHLDIDYVREQSLRGDVAVLRATVVALTRALGS